MCVLFNASPLKAGRERHRRFRKMKAKPDLHQQPSETKMPVPFPSFSSVGRPALSSLFGVVFALLLASQHSAALQQEETSFVEIKKRTNVDLQKQRKRKTKPHDEIEQEEQSENQKLTITPEKAQVNLGQLFKDYRNRNGYRNGIRIRCYSPESLPARREPGWTPALISDEPSLSEYVYRVQTKLLPDNLSLQEQGKPFENPLTPDDVHLLKATV
ncbi:unnamed protein product, partial [Amoebophrya sp. A25]|eukprot:GSA25T00012366001.1